jgi:hypothetical protein
LESGGESWWLEEPCVAFLDDATKQGLGKTEDLVLEVVICRVYVN